jgi:antitoxin (DNA-binding transcriptional repressor) of toxin-antitoxin stability system
MKTVTMLEFRKDAAKVLRWLARGDGNVRLTYRGRPVADLVPVQAGSANRPACDDPFYRLGEWAVEGANLTNEAIDRLLYEQP